MKMITPKLEVKNLRFSSSEERISAIKGIFAICETHIWMDVTTIQELSMKAYNILRQREEDLPAPNMEGDGVSFAQNRQRRDMSMSGATVVSRWDIMQTHQNAPTINQTPTKAMIQMATIVRQLHKEEMESMC